MKLLTVGNPKTEKSTQFGYLTGILHLAPVRLGRRNNVCEFASAGCIKACLNTAGRGGMFKKGANTNKVQEARIRRTQLLFDDSNTFQMLMLKDIEALADMADKNNLGPCLRLNGTSDIDWFGDYPAVYNHAKDLGVEIYDYTKDLFKINNNTDSDYHLTYSRTELDSDEAITDLLRSGISVAIVFRDYPPTQYLGHKVINGDLHDLRFLDPSGVIVGLKAKGRAKKDTTGFVI